MRQHYKSKLLVAFGCIVTWQTANSQPEMGIRVGSFYVDPQYTNTSEYIDNIYYRDEAIGGVVGSYVNHFSPSLDVQSDWNRHRLGFSVNTDITEYSSNSDANNYHDVFSKLDGQLDITKDSYLKGAFNYDYAHEGRGSPDQRLGYGRTFYDNKGFNGLFHQQFNRLSFESAIDINRYDCLGSQSHTEESGVRLLRQPPDRTPRGSGGRRLPTP